MNKEEIWKAIEGFEGYAVSNLGRVMSLKYGKERILKPNKVKGYLRVQLCRNGKRKTLLVHRLVAEAFIPNPYGLPEINHKDENKINNALNNIEWCDRLYNNNYGNRNKKISKAKSKAVEASRFSDFRTIELRFSSTREADRNGYFSSHVSDCCRGCYCREGNNKYQNLYWRYAV